jgi:hypothetical protein
MSAKGGGWGGGQQDEGGGRVGRKKGSRRVGVGRSFPKKALGLRVGKKKSDKKIVPRKKKQKRKRKN